MNIRQWVSQPLEETRSWTRYVIFHIRIWLHCFRLLGTNQCLTQAAALAYHTIFGIVPLTIVTFMVFQMFPASHELGERLRRSAYDMLNLTIAYPAAEAEPQAEEPDAEDQERAALTVASKLEQITQGYIARVSTGAITVISVLLVSWAAIALMNRIERTFNRIYHVSTGRRFLSRLFNYWGLLTLGAIFITAVLYVHTQSMIASGLYLRVVNLIQPVIPFLTSLAAIFALYFFLPNTRVAPGSALWGAFVATVIWTAARFFFRWYVGTFLPQFAVYGVLGLIPVTVLWIYITWLIILFGLQLTYATQNIRRLDAAELSRARQQERCFLANDRTVIRMMEYVLNAFEHKDQKPVSVESVAYRLDMPVDFTDKILNHLVGMGLLCHTSEPTVGFVPATDGTHITLAEISRTIEGISFAQPKEQGSKLEQVFAEVEKHLAGYSLKDVLNPKETFTDSGPPLQDQEVRD
jgi:YihY family inner membrane protein